MEEKEEEDGKTRDLRGRVGGERPERRRRKRGKDPSAGRGGGAEGGG